MKLEKLLDDLKKLDNQDLFKELITFNEYWDSLENCSDLIRELLQLSPKCEALLNVLGREGLKPKDLNHVFTALGNVLLTIASIATEHSLCAKTIMQQLFEKYSSCMSQILLGRNNSAVMVPLLRCLTAAVLASEDAAAVVVSSLDWTMLRHVIKRRDPMAERDARSWVIYLFYALFDQDKNVAVFEQFLKSGALSMVYEGLQQDPYERTVSIITLLKEKIIHNPAVSKSLKVQLFNGDTLPPLIKLHEWTKPKENNETHAELEASEVTKQGRKEISDALSQFLIALCSSYRFGIIFSISDSGKISNGHTFQIIKKLSLFSLTDSNYRDVVSSTLHSCPDIIPSYADHIKNSLDVNPNKYFIALMQVYIGMLSKIKGFTLVKKNGKAIIQLLLPPPITGTLVHAIITHKSQDLELRYIGLRLVESILTAAESAITALQNASQYMKATDVKKAVIEFVCCSVPTPNLALSLWDDVNQAQTPSEQHNERLLTVVKMLTLFVQFLPSPDFVNTIKADQMLASVTKMTSISDEGKLQLIIHCLQLINSLQSKFDVLTQAQDEIMQQELLNTFKLLLTLYLDIFNNDDNESKVKTRLEPIMNHIEKSLINYGLYAHSEANIQFWLEALIGRGESCVDFLCKSIIVTIASLEHFSDKIVVITRNTTLQEHFQVPHFSESFPSDVTFEDSTDITAINVPLSFSRLILGNLEMLSKTKSKEVAEYFSSVMKRYIQHLPDPQVLAQYLLTDSDVAIPDHLAQYCHCWLGQKPRNLKFIKMNKVAESYAGKLEYVFLSKDFSFASVAIENSLLPESLEGKKELMNTVLLYLQVDTSDRANVEKEESVKAYLNVVRHLLKRTLADSVEEITKPELYHILLNHPSIFNNYNPFAPDIISDFVCSLLDDVFAEPENSRDVVMMYFKQCFSKLQCVFRLEQEPGTTDFWQPFKPFLTSQIKEYNLTKNLLETLFSVLSSHYHSESYLTLLCQVIELLGSFGMSASAKQDRSLIALMKTNLRQHFNLVMHANPPPEQLVDLFRLLSEFVAEAMQPNEAEEYDHNSLKWLVSTSRVFSGTLLVRVLELHPQHTSYVYKRLQKAKPQLPGHAAPLLHLLQNCDSATIDGDARRELLVTVQPCVLSWLKHYEANDEPGYRVLTSLLCQAGLIGAGDACSAVRAAFSRLVESGEAPPQHIIAICLICENLKGHKKEAKLPTGDALLAVMQLLLCSIERLCSRHVSSRHERRLLDAVQYVLQLLPKLQRRTRLERADTTIWNKFTKKVLKTSLRFPSPLHISLVRCLTATVAWQLSHGEDSQVRSLHRQLLANARYHHLMTEQDADPQGDLKEAVVSLQCLLVSLCPATTEDCPVTRLLAAYTASTSLPDQTILQLLRQYDKYGALYSVVPVVWGSAATALYGSPGAVDAPAPVLKQPRPEHVLAALERQAVLHTCINYDRNMSYKPSVRCLPSPPGSLPVYDLRYVLPSMTWACQQLRAVPASPHQGVAPALAVAVAALAARCPVIRSQAAALIRSVRILLQSIQYDRMRLFWMWLVDIVCYSLANVAAGWSKEGKEAGAEEKPVSVWKVAPLTGPVMRYLVETILTADHPEDPLYSTLMNYMFLFPYMRTNKIPEMQRLSHHSSPNIQGPARLLLLRLISEGVRTADDFTLVKRANAPPLIMAMLQSPTSTHAIQVEALHALEAIVSTSNGCNRLMRHHELILLLPTLVERSATVHDRQELLHAVLQLLQVAWTLQEEASRNTPASMENQEKIELEETKRNEQQDYDENWQGEDGYDEEYYEYEGYEYSDTEEEKAKVRKKRKLEAKNKRAAKRAKLEEEATANANSKSGKSWTSVTKIDNLLICDVVWCLSSIADRVYQTTDDGILEIFESLVSSIANYVKTNVKVSKMSNGHLGMALHSLTRRVAVTRVVH